MTYKVAKNNFLFHKLIKQIEVKIMQKFDIHYLAIILLMSFTACSKYNGKPQSIGKSKVKSRVFVDNVQSAQTINASENLTIEVSGNLPSPAHSLKGFDVKVDGKFIEITPVTEFNSSVMAAQVLVPFQKTVTVENLKPGKYKVKVISGSDMVFEGKQVEVK